MLTNQYAVDQFRAGRRAVITREDLDPQQDSATESPYVREWNINDDDHTEQWEGALADPRQVESPAAAWRRRKAEARARFNPCYCGYPACPECHTVL